MSENNVYEDAGFFQRYRRMREGSDSPNELIEQPALRACLPPLEGLDVLELGCGMGQLTLYLAEQGANRVLALDSSEKMLDVARRERSHPGVEYERRAVEEMQPAPEGFDLVVSSLAVHYVANYPALVREVSNCLKSGGRFVYSVEHPMKTAPQVAGAEWISDGKGGVYWPLNGYCDEGAREREWFGERVVRYHRKISTLIGALISCSMEIETLEEPIETPDPGHDIYFPEHRERPPVLIIGSIKREAS